MTDPRQVILRPVVSEKSYAMIGDNRYTFEVEKHATKPQIASCHRGDLRCDGAQGEHDERHGQAAPPSLEGKARRVPGRRRSSPSGRATRSSSSRRCSSSTRVGDTRCRRARYGATRHRGSPESAPQDAGGSRRIVPGGESAIGHGRSENGTEEVQADLTGSPFPDGLGFLRDHEDGAGEVAA